MDKRKLVNDYPQVMKQQKLTNNSSLSEDGTLQYDFMTSLTNITMAKIITNLWMKQTTNLEQLFRTDAFKSKISDTWGQFERNVVTLVSELHLLGPLTKKLASIVPLIGDSFLNWIRYHDEFIFHSECSAVDQIINIAWTARGRIDYAQTATNILSNQCNTLSDEHKYKLACAYCLENEIYVLAHKVVNQDYILRINIDTHTMVCFWTAKLTGDNRILDCSPYKDRAFNIRVKQTIFEFLLKKDASGVKRTCNEVAIKFIWNQFNEEQKAETITFALKNLGNQDLRYSLLSSLNFELQQKVLKQCSSIILGDIFNDWLWGEFFMQTALNTLPVIDPLSYLDIMNRIIREINKNYDDKNEYLYNRYKSIFSQLWLNGPKHLKDCIFGHMDGYLLHRLIIRSVCSERDMDIISLIYKDLNSQQKKNVFFGNKGIGRCTCFIRRYRWDLVKLFIEYTTLPDYEDDEYYKYVDEDDELFDDDDVHLMKTLLQDRGDRIAFYFFVQESSNKIDHFLSWAFQSKEEIDDFKQSLANFDMLLESIIVNNSADFTKSENQSKRCSSEDLEVMNRFKAEFPTSISGKCLIGKLLLEDKYELLDKVLNWCFCHNRQKIIRFKSDMYKDEPTLVQQFIVSIRRDKIRKMLDKFIDWSFTNGKEVQEFKSWTVYPTDDDESDTFEELCSTDDEIDEFKGLYPTNDIDAFEGLYPTDDEIDAFEGQYPTNDEIDAFEGLYPTNDEIDAFEGLYPTDDEE